MYTTRRALRTLPILYASYDN